MAAAPDIGYPIIVRPSFTLGGTGGGIAYNLEDLKQLSADGLAASMITEVMLEESVVGWKEFELEVMRDFQDNVVIICSIENLDPMGVHTGDSITVAPAQTLTDREYQAMRDAAIAIIREIGVETGGSNIQFAINPENGEMVIIEMNPRVSRSSALASKATGFPIAKIAAKLAVGYTLDEIHNDITRETYASFEPTIDYCVVKIPRWAFEKFPGAEDFLTTSMKSVGEVDGHRPHLQGGPAKRHPLPGDLPVRPGRRRQGPAGPVDPELRTRLRVPNSQRLFYLRQAFRVGHHRWTKSTSSPASTPGSSTRSATWWISPMNWPVSVNCCGGPRPGPAPGHAPAGQGVGLLRPPARPPLGRRRGPYRPDAPGTWHQSRLQAGGHLRRRFEAYTPYFYSTYEWEDEARRTDRRQGHDPGRRPQPHRPGHRVRLLLLPGLLRPARRLGVESIMVNSNPETVSTDYDTSDKLYFEPLTREDVLKSWTRKSLWA